MAICIVVPTIQTCYGPYGLSKWPIEAIFINKEKKLEVKLLFWNEKDCCKTKIHQGIEFELKKFQHPHCDWDYL